MDIWGDNIIYVEPNSWNSQAKMFKKMLGLTKQNTLSYI